MAMTSWREQTYCRLLLWICILNNAIWPSFSSERSIMDMSTATRSCDARKSGVTLRLFLVRHGETEANVKKLVVGQSDSPLTDLGVEQAKALGRCHRQWRDQTSFWRIYSSDLQRTRLTTHLLLLSMRRSNNDEIAATDRADIISDAYNPNDDPMEVTADVIFDARLRELAKGARQGLPKSLPYALALEERQRRVESGEIPESEASPLLESEDDGWNRAVKWLQEVVDDVVQEVRTVCSSDGTDTVYTVLAVAHAGLNRVFLQRLLGPERLRSHPDATYDKSDGRFAVPNTSLTILDLQIDLLKPNDDCDDANAIQNLPPSSIANIDIVLLTSTEHYGDIRASEATDTSAAACEREQLQSVYR